MQARPCSRRPVVERLRLGALHVGIEPAEPEQAGGSAFARAYRDRSAVRADLDGDKRSVVHVSSRIMFLPQIAHAAIRKACPNIAAGRLRRPAKPVRPNPFCGRRRSEFAGSSCFSIWGCWCLPVPPRVSFPIRCRLNEPCHRKHCASPRKNPSPSWLWSRPCRRGAAETGCVELVRILAGAGHRPIVLSRGGRLEREVTQSAASSFLPTPRARIRR